MTNTNQKNNKVKTFVGIILIVVAIFLAYLGVTGLKESTTAVNFLGIELRAEDSGEKQIAIIQLVGSIISFTGGIYLLGSKKR